MPTATDIGQITVSYICPECKRRVERNIPFIKKDNGKKELTSAGWCPWIYCEARHKLSYKVVHKEQQPKIKGLLFFSNEEEHIKRLQILAWR